MGELVNTSQQINPGRAIEEDRPQSVDDSFSRMMEQIDRMREQNLFCDFDFHVLSSSLMDPPSRRAKKFPVHKVIISSSLKYFEGFFRFHGSSNETNVDADQKDFEAMMKFAYNRDVSGINDENCFYIITMADYYGAESLLKYCVDYFVENILDLKYAVEIFEALIFLNGIELGQEMKILYEHIWIFLLREFTKIRGEIIDALPHEIFHKIVASDHLNVKDEKCVWDRIVSWLEHDPERLKFFDTHFFKSCRLGLLPNSFFMDHVKRHKFVSNNVKLRPIIIDVIKFYGDLQTSSELFLTPDTPDFALPRTPHEVLFAIAGWRNGVPQSCIESYDSRADRWNRVAYEDPIGPRAYHGTVVLEKLIYCIGGFNGTEYFNTCSVFNPETLRWKEIAPMHSKRCYVSVSVINGEIYAMGGYDGQTRLRTAEKYNPETNQWSFINPMHYQRSDANSCSTKNRIYIVGGFSGHECLNSVEYYDVDIDEWIMIPTMNTRRSGVNCAILNDFLYVVGGFNGTNRMNSGEKIEIFGKNPQWIRMASMFHRRSNFGMEVLDDDSIMVAGGYNGTITIKHCEVYYPDKDEWVQATDMNFIRSALTLVAVKGLYNYKDFIYQDREKLLRERRHNLNISSTATIFPNLQQTVSLPQPLEFLREVNDPEEDAFFDFEEENPFFDDEEIEEEEMEEEIL